MALKPKRWRRGFTAGAGLGLVAALWCAAEANLAAGEAMPDDDALLTLEEWRWCRFERLRHEGGGNGIRFGIAVAGFSLAFISR